MDTGPDRQSMSLHTGGICKIRTAVRYHSRFFVQAAHEITYESSERKYFFTILYLDLPKLSTEPQKLVHFFQKKVF